MAVRRNLLIILVHGFRSDAMGDTGSWPKVTPNLDRMCQRGRRLIATSACPADNGGMISLLTGLHARQHGCVDTGLGKSTTGWTRWLAAQNYHLTGVGGVGPVLHHFHDVVPVEDVSLLESQSCAYMAHMEESGQLRAIQLQRRQRLRHGPFDPDRLPLDPDDDIDGFIATEAIKKLEQQPETNPWALVVAFSGPGNDLPPPAIYDQVVEPELLEGAFIPADLTQVDVLAELDYPRVMLQRLNPTSIGRIRADYLGRVSLVDHGIGRIVRALGQRPDRDKIWVVMASDRGQLLGEHGLVGQRSFLAGAIETPVLIVPPTPVRSTASPHDVYGVSTVDVAATIALLGGCDLPRAVAGRSMLPLIVDPKAPEFELDGTACISEFGNRLMFHADNYKVVFDTNFKKAIGLYDVANDADEFENIIEDPVASSVLDALRWRLTDVLMPLRAMAK